MRISVDSRLADLAEAMNAAAVGVDTWDAALSRLAAATGAKAGELISLGASPFHIITEIGDQMGRFIEIQGHDPSVNSRVRVGLRAPELAVLDEADFDTEGDGRRHPDYGALIDDLDIPFACISVLQKGPETTLGLSMLRTGRAGPMSNEQKRIFEAAAPHVRAAVRLQMATEGRAMELTAAGFDQAGTPAFVMDRAGRLRAWSASADALIERGDVTVKDGRLKLRNPFDLSLGLAVERARRVRRISDAPPATVRSQDRDGLVYTLDVMPLPSRHGFDFDAGVVVVARPPRDIERRASQLAALLFTLTPTESAVAGLLAAGFPAQTIAERQGVALSTVRTHIRRLLDKTGSRSQLELVTSILARL